MDCAVCGERPADVVKIIYARLCLDCVREFDQFVGSQRIAKDVHISRARADAAIESGQIDRAAKQTEIHYDAQKQLQALALKWIDDNRTDGKGEKAEPEVATVDS